LGTPTRKPELTVDAFTRFALSVNRAALRGAAKGGAAAGRGVDALLRSRGARRGVLAPGDRTPVGGSWYDYRGVLDLRRVPDALRTAPFPLGRYVHPARGPGAPIGLPESAVAQHVAVVGPSGGGKTTGLIVPWILAGLRAGFSVVTVDVKGDLLDRVRDEARRQGRRAGIRPMSLDYTRPDRSISWNWLAELDSDRAIDNAVQSILGRQPTPGTDPYFFNLDGQILRGVLELVAASPRRDTLTAAAVLRLLRDQDQLTRVLGRTSSPTALMRLRDLPGLMPDDYLKRITGVAVRLDALAKPTVEAVTARNELRAEDVLRRPHLVSVVAPVQDGQMAQMLSSLFINQLLFRAYQRFSGLTGVRLLLVLDEAAALSDRVDIPNLLSVARAAGVTAVIAVQDVAQFATESERSVVFANCGTLICLDGVSPESAKLLSARIGEHPVQTVSTSRGPSPSGWTTSTSTSTGTQMAPVLGLREIMAPPFGGRIATVHCRDLADAPMLVDLTLPP
jgi:type IV secretory pathway TraG/TraD family ATPase VirD4